MTEQQLLGPRAFGTPCASAILKHTPEDFQVDEQLQIELSGSGEHLWLWVEKRQLNTEDAARILARAAGVPLRQVGYAGLKDRPALTRQWFSLHLPGKQTDLAGLQDERLQVLQQQRHSRKLQRGAHSGNAFRLRLRNVQGDLQQLEQRLEQVVSQGVPNYFGLQRFGFGGSNVQQALEFARSGQLPPRRNQRARLLSSARSFLFNQILAARVADGSWQQAQIGDVLGFTNSRSSFVASIEDLQDPRLAMLDVHPTAALWGNGQSMAGGMIAGLEQAVAGKHEELCRWLEQTGLKQERRITRLPVSGFRWCYPEQNVLELRFALPVGCFATVVLRELLAFEDVNIPCEF